MMRDHGMPAAGSPPGRPPDGQPAWRGAGLVGFPDLGRHTPRPRKPTVIVGRDWRRGGRVWWFRLDI